MRAIGVRELQNHASRVLHEVTTQRRPVDITRHGRVIARLVPVDEPPTTEDLEQVERVLTNLDKLAEEISARQTGDLTLARNTYRELLQLPTLRIVPIDYRLGAATATLAINLGLRAADAVYVALAQILAIPLITWDEQQRTRSATTITAAIPTL